MTDNVEEQSKIKQTAWFKIALAVILAINVVIIAFALHNRARSRKLKSRSPEEMARKFISRLIAGDKKRMKEMSVPEMHQGLDKLQPLFPEENTGDLEVDKATLIRHQQEFRVVYMIIGKKKRVNVGLFLNFLKDGWKVTRVKAVSPETRRISFEIPYQKKRRIRINAPPVFHPGQHRPKAHKHRQKK